VTYIVSWNAISSPAFAKITPVTPPIVNNSINPNTKSKGVLNDIHPPNKVDIQENILIPVGTAIIIVAAVK